MQKVRIPGRLVSQQWYGYRSLMYKLLACTSESTKKISKLTSEWPRQRTFYWRCEWPPNDRGQGRCKSVWVPCDHGRSPPIRTEFKMFPDIHNQLQELCNSVIWPAQFLHDYFAQNRPHWPCNIASLETWLKPGRSHASHDEAHAGLNVSFHCLSF